MPGPIDIRTAQPADAAVAAILLYSAYAHTLVTFPPDPAPEGDWIERLQDRFGHAGNRFSYELCQVAQAGSAVVGLVLSFGGRDEQRLNDAVGSWLAREARADEWYVDALAVLRDWGRRGIGTRLLAAAEQQARQHGYARIALHVAQDNQPARDFYAHLGYVATGEAAFYEHDFVRMERSLDAAAGQTPG